MSVGSHQWLTFMPKFKNDFEFRRNLFGLVAILSLDQTQLPGVVQQNMADIAKWVASLSVQSYKDREKTV